MLRSRNLLLSLACLLALALLSPFSASAGITLDANTNSVSVSSTTLTFAKTVAVGASFLSVEVVIREPTGSVTTISSVTYAGVAMTSAIQRVSSDTVTRSAVFYLQNPATGSNNVVVTTAAATFATYGSANSWFGALTSGNPVRATGSGASTGTAVSAAVSSIVVGDLVIDTAGVNLALFNAKGAAQTALRTTGDTTVASYQIADATTETHTWTLDGSVPWSMAIAAFIPRKGASSLLGVGQ